jgi:hypothetical protein
VLSLLEISDRLEIQEVLANYSTAVDRHDWDLWDEVFTEDAVLDYTEISDFRGDRQSTKEWLQMMPPTGTYYHMTSTTKITIDGDTAETRTICFNPMPAPEDGLRLIGHWYRDQWVRTPAGWRIKDRYYERCYAYPLPGLAEAPAQN